MKKILTMLLALVMVFSMFTINSFAKEQTATVTMGQVTVDPSDTQDVVVPITITPGESEMYLVGFAIALEVTEGLTLKSVNTSSFSDGGATIKYDASSSNLKDFRVNFADDDGGWGDNGEGYINKETVINFTFSIAEPQKEAKYDIKWIVSVDDTDIFDVDYDSVIADFVDGYVEVKAAGPSVATVTPTAATLTDVAYAEGVEAGQAVSMTFEAADIKDYTGMNWELTFADAKKYAVVDYPAATIAALDGASPVQFVAAFRVQSRNEALNAITGIAAGFGDAENGLLAKTTTFNVTPVPTPAE